MKKILIPALVILGIFLVLGGAWFLVQALEQKTTQAQGVVTYNEIWVATGGIYGDLFFPSYGGVYMRYLSGIPSSDTKCGIGGPSYGYAASCQFSPTVWSVVGTINSGVARAKRYFITQRQAYYNYSSPDYGNLQTLTASFCNSDPNNPGGFFHPYLEGATGRFVPDGTIVQGPYGSGRSGFDTYTYTSLPFWSTRDGEYSYLKVGKVLGGMTLRGKNTYYPLLALQILCVED